MRPVISDQLPDIDIANSVAVSKHKWLIADIGLNPLDPAPGNGFNAGIDQSHRPGFGGVVVNNPLALILEIEGYIRFVEKVVGKVLFDKVSLIAETDDEIIEAIMGIDFHDVPENRPFTDL